MKEKKKITLSTYQTALAIVWCVCLLLLAVGYFGLFQPQQMSLDKSKRDLTESNDILMLAQRAAKPGTLENLQDRCQVSCESVANYSIDEDDITDMVFDIGQIANQLGLQEYSSNIQEKIPVSTVSRSPSLRENWISVKFMGSFHQFAEFVNELERNHPIVFIEKINFQRDNDTTNRNEIRMELSFIATKQGTVSTVAMAKTQ